MFSNMDKFIITTTPTIEWHPIKAYLGAINVNVVIGANFFSDFAASFTDVSGCNSCTEDGCHVQRVKKLRP